MHRLNSNEFTVGEAISGFLDQHKLTDELLVRRVIADWPNIVGRTIADQTEELWFKRGRFFLKMKHPAWKHQMLYARTELLERIHQAAGRPLAQELRIV